MTATLDYLETDDYIAMAWLRAAPSPVFSLRADYDIDLFADFDEQHDRYCEANEGALCTGDGFRWNPELPALRFR